MACRSKPINSWRGAIARCGRARAPAQCPPPAPGPRSGGEAPCPASDGARASGGVAPSPGPSPPPAPSGCCPPPPSCPGACAPACPSPPPGERAQPGDCACACGVEVAVLGTTGTSVAFVGELMYWPKKGLNSTGSVIGGKGVQAPSVAFAM